MSSIGASTITITYSGSISGKWTELSDQRSSSGHGSSTIWSLDTTGATSTSSSTSTITFPSLMLAGSGELYFGYSDLYGTGTAGSTSGFSYAVTAGTDLVTYDPNTSTTVAPALLRSHPPAATRRRRR